MGKLVSIAASIGLAVLSIAAVAQTAANKQSSAKKGVVTAHKKSGKKGPVRKSATTWRNRQLTPTPARYKEIQQALSSKGYLPPEQANGTWNDSSTVALRKFQADQNLDGNGKINSLSLIALGLGPKH